MTSQSITRVDIYQAITDQIMNGRNGVMPTWEARFSPETIKALAVYVHANAGGDVGPAAAAPVAAAPSPAPAGR